MERTQTVVWLARHGETNYQYQPEIKNDQARELTEQGKKQARAIGQYLSNFTIAQIYSSPLWRCRQTARIIADCLDSVPSIEQGPKLAELYEEDMRARQGRAGEKLLEEAVQLHKGSQIVAVTHQFLICYIVEDFYFGNPFGHRPECGELYRLLFADSRLVDIALLHPPTDNEVSSGKNS